MSGTASTRGGFFLVPLALLACGSGSSSDDDPPPAAPTGLTAPAITSGRIGLSWTDNATDETGFSIERSPDGALGWTEVGTTAADTTVFTDVGLAPDTAYYYRVRAVGPGGWSGYTSTLLATTANMAWQPSPTTPVSLTARQGHSAIYDSLNQRMVVFGGDDGVDFHNEVWVLPLTQEDLSTASWALLSINGTPPSGRFFHSAIYDPTRSRMVVFGGRNLSPNNDIWILNLPDTGTPEWSQLVLPFGPSARVLHSAIYDAANDRMVVFGGSSGADVSSEVWALRFSGVGAPSWASLGNADLNLTPIELSEHAAIYDPIDQRMIVYGGGGGPSLNESVYSATLPAVAVPAWSLVTSTTPPVARATPAAVYDSANRRMVVFGGYDSGFFPLGDLWSLSLSGAPVWKQVTPSGTAAPGRSNFSAVYDPLWERMVVFSGLDPNEFLYVDDLAWPLKF